MNAVQAQVSAGAAASAAGAAGTAGIAQPEEIVRQAVTTGRLVVVIPDVPEAAALAARIQLIAHARRLDVLLIGTASQLVSAAELRRKLTLLAAFLQNAGTKAQVRVEQGLDWIPGFQPLLADGDLLACCVDASLPSAGDRMIDLLANRFQRPVYAFMDAGIAKQPRRSLIARLAPWVGSLAIILGFFWLQVGLAQNQAGAAYSTAWLIVSVPVEIGAVWLFNSLLG